MSKAVHRRVMESSVPLELTPGTGGVGSSSTPGSSLRKEKLDHRLLGPQGQAHLNGCVPLSHQVAGHKYGVDKVGILQHPDGTVLKQVQPPPRGPREMQFYGMVFAEGCSDPCLLNLQNHIPKYYGTWASPDSCSDSELYLKLEDVTSRFVRPCIMDVKLGQRSYDPFASQEKREQQIRKYPLMEEIGFLILGMRVYNVRSDSFDSYDQHYGRSLDKDTVKDGLARFFHNGVYLRKDAIWASIHRVQKILHWFYSQNQLAFFASSLLFVYEGLPSSSCFSFFRNAPVSDTVMTTGTLLLGDGGQSHEMTAVKEGPRQEKEVVENNNNTEEPVSWDHSPTSVYTGQRNFCGSGRLLKNSGDYVATQKMTTSDLEDRASALYEGDNTCQRTCEQKPPTNGNKGKNADGEREKSSRMEEEGLKALGRGGGGEDNMEDLKVEVKMIDFAHVFPSDSHDQGYIYGLKHLVTVLEQILCDAAQSSLSPSTS